MFRRPTLRVAMVVAAMVAAACGSPRASVPRDALPPASEAPVPAKRPADGLPESHGLPAGALPAFSYAGIRYEPQGGVIQGTTARVTLSASAPSKFEVPLDAEIRLTFANGAEIKAALPSLGASQVTVVELAGPVPPDTTWDGATLSITEAGREPFQLRFGDDGEQPPDALEATGTAKVLTRYGDQVSYEVLGASFASDGPRRGGFYGRAPEGQRFLRTRIAATNVDGRHGVSIGEEAFQLTTDVGPASIAVGVNAQALALGQRGEFEVVFLVPKQARTFTLRVGADADTPGQITLRSPQPTSDSPPAPRS